jgi:aspartyl-tRNA(Asn)/glutamyl-tRNA(Gln) amidotransferase subunit A
MDGEPDTIATLASALKARKITSEALTERCLNQITTHNSSLNTFITVLADNALAQARTLDRETAQGRYRGPLHGVPLSVKDLMDLSGTATTAASRVRADHLAHEDAAAVARLRAAGAVFVGKTNLHEFALGPTNEDSAYGPALHPLDPKRLPGGSSGGSAASVVAGMACASIGTDTGGSVRIPASACGLVGLKPTLGEIPLEGVVPLSPTLDHVGPLCQSVEDASIVFETLCGREPAPAMSAGSPRGVRLGLLREHFMARLDTEVASVFADACARLTAAGVATEAATIPHVDQSAAIYVHIALAEAAAYHAKTLESRGGDYTPNVRLRLEIGRCVLAEDYLRALRGRSVLRAEVDSALNGRDALLLPTLAIPAPLLGTQTVQIGGAEEPIRNAMLRLTQLFNITGHPAITVPCGKTPGGLPVGAQLVGHFGRTAQLLQTARALESSFREGSRPV